MSHVESASSHNPSREEIYDEMTSHIEGDKPTGEWTEEMVESKYRTYGAPALTRAINAALAAERRAAQVKANEDVAVRDINHLNQIRELEQQLAAERRIKPS